LAGTSIAVIEGTSAAAFDADAVDLAGPVKTGEAVEGSRAVAGLAGGVALRAGAKSVGVVAVSAVGSAGAGAGAV
jgi:hypothetical protein